MTHVNENESKWPTAQMLWFGTFGADSPAAKRWRRRGFAALGLMMLFFLAGGILRHTIPPAVASYLVVAVPSLLWIYIGIEWWRYIDTLTELEKRMQLEAAAWTYIVVMVLAGVAGFVAAVYPSRFNTPMLLILVEPLRGLRLWWIARRY